MSLNDPLANAFSKIESYENLGRKTVELIPSSKLLKNILTILNELGYVGSFEEVDDSRGGKITLNLIGKVNKCGVIKPRFHCKFDDFEKYEKRYLPAKGFGVIFISTSQGLMIHSSSKEKKIGGKLIAYCY